MKSQAYGTHAAVISLVLAMAASAFWLLVPTGASVSSGRAIRGADSSPPGVKPVSVSESFTPNGEVVVRETSIDASGRRQVREYRRPAPEVRRHTLLEAESAPDAQIVGMLAFPVVLAALPLALDRTRLRTPARAIAAAFLLAGSLLTGLSIGLYYLPSALAMTVAAALGGRPRG